MTHDYRAVLLAVLLAVSLVGVVAAPAAASHEDGDCSFPVSVMDATGTEVTVDDAPEEIVTLDAASAQTCWEIGAEERITGTPVRSYTE
jgi:iron complex transport system substrate-binding protein